MRIMLADDEPGIHSIVQRIVTDSGHEFFGAFSGTEALEMFDTKTPDLLILDVMMPEMDGFQVCRTLRRNGVFVPVIFLSAKGDIVDKGVGFEAGGDDYLVKPFSPQELLMRIEAHLRREGRSMKKIDDVIRINGLVIDRKRLKATVKGRQVELTPKEFMILGLLASHPGEVFTREQLTEEVWGKEFVGETSSIAVFIRKIREKIEDDPSKPRYIQTVWRAGYRFGD